MKPVTGIIAIAVFAAATAGAGYWFGQHNAGNKSSATSASSPENAKGERKLLYYRNPMGLADTSPTPKKDPMGMDYVAVYEGEDESASGGEPASPNQVRISTEKI